MDKELTVRIIGEDLADIDFGERGAGAGRSRLFLGIQKGQEVINAVPVTEISATFTAHFSVSPLPDGGTNFLGPYAHGTRTARFCYLSWLVEEENGQKSMFSRIKIPLSQLSWAQVEEAVSAGIPVILRFSLLGKRGGPICASVPHDAIHYEKGTF